MFRQTVSIKCKETKANVKLVIEGGDEAPTAEGFDDILSDLKKEFLAFGAEKRKEEEDEKKDPSLMDQKTFERWRERKRDGR